MPKIKLKDLMDIIVEYEEVNIYDKNRKFITGGIIGSKDFDFEKIKESEVLSLSLSLYEIIDIKLK